MVLLCVVYAQVMEAVRGLRTIYPSKGARLVPLKERPAAITVNRAAKAAIERDSWVRVRGGLYKDDLAKVRFLNLLTVFIQGAVVVFG
jgi:transcription elongation factor SPT5